MMRKRLKFGMRGRSGRARRRGLGHRSSLSEASGSSPSRWARWPLARTSAPSTAASHARSPTARRSHVGRVGLDDVGRRAAGVDRALDALHGAVRRHPHLDACGRVRWSRAPRACSARPSPWCGGRPPTRPRGRPRARHGPRRRACVGGAAYAQAIGGAPSAGTDARSAQAGDDVGGDLRRGRRGCPGTGSVVARPVGDDVGEAELGRPADGVLEGGGARQREGRGGVEVEVAGQARRGRGRRRSSASSTRRLWPATSAHHSSSVSALPP